MKELATTELRINRIEKLLKEKIGTSFEHRTVEVKETRRLIIALTGYGKGVYIVLSDTDITITTLHGPLIAMPFEFSSDTTFVWAVKAMINLLKGGK